MLHISLFKKLPEHLLRKILRYTTAVRPRYLDNEFFKIPIKKQWCYLCGEKVFRNLNPPRTLKCSDCWNVMCLKCVRQRSTPSKPTECCPSTTKMICLC